MSTTQSPPTTEQADGAVKDALARMPRAAKLEAFFQLCASGKDVATALTQSGIVAPMGYDPSGPESEVETEELFYGRCAARIDKSRTEYPYAVLPDDKVDPETAKPGDLTTSQLYRLVDWLYFVRAMPIIAIAKALQIPTKFIAEVKANLSNDFAKTIRLQHAEGWIADLLRTKDLLRADLTTRRNALDKRDTIAAVRIDTLLFELENRFLDRLQEIGLIDKNLGKIDIHEEWHVSIDPVSGAPSNKMLENVSQEPFTDAELVTTARQTADSTKDEHDISSISDAERLLAAVSKNMATIKVGGA